MASSQEAEMWMLLLDLLVSDHGAALLTYRVGGRKNDLEEQSSYLNLETHHKHARYLFPR